MKISYSPAHGTVRIAFDGRAVGDVETEEVRPGFLVSSDAKGRIISALISQPAHYFSPAALAAMPPSGPTWLTLEEAAADARDEGESITAATLRRQIHDGRIRAGVRKAGKTWLIEYNALWSYLDSRAPTRSMTSVS